MSKVKDISGQQFGSWTVLSFEGVKSPHGACFRVRCICGTERSVLAKTLKQGTSTSCGCSFRKPPGESCRNSLFRTYQREAANRGYTFNLSLEVFTRLTSAPCFYCGVPPLQVHKNMQRYMAPYPYNGIDRVDTTNGYIEDNCVTCCGECNRMKRTATYEDFIARCRRVVLAHDARVKALARVGSTPDEPA